MSPPYDWKMLACELSEEDAEVLLQALKEVTVFTSHLMPCSACSSAVPHSMRYRILKCACKQCMAVAPFAECAWRIKQLTCMAAKTVTLYEDGTHLSPAMPSKKPVITRAQKVFIQEMTRENLTPLRILHAMTRKFGKSLQELPELRKVQNAVNHYCRTKLGGNDRYRELSARVVAATYTGREGDHDAFVFTANADGSGRPIVGDGSDANPFVVGVTTKALLRSANRDPSMFILHVDATFQLDQVSYPVIVCGMSDGARKFHLLALFIASQLEERHYTDALASLQTVYAQVVGSRLNVQYMYVMGDVDKTQYNGIKNVFGLDGEYTFLMCFYHEVAKVRLALKERTQGLHGDRLAEVYRDIYDQHFSTSAEEFTARKESMLQSWKKHQDLDKFRAYMVAYHCDSNP